MQCFKRICCITNYPAVVGDNVICSGTTKYLVTCQSNRVSRVTTTDDQVVSTATINGIDTTIVRVSTVNIIGCCTAVVTDYNTVITEQSIAGCVPATRDYVTARTTEDDVGTSTFEAVHCAIVGINDVIATECRIIKPAMGN